MNKNKGMPIADKNEIFLYEYLILCLKHDTCISSCGCCNSPYLRWKIAKDFLKFNVVEYENIDIDFEKEIIEFDLNGVSYYIDKKGLKWLKN